MSSSRVQFIRQASLPTRDSKAPPLDARWLHKGRLDSEPSSKKTKWIAFADADNEDIEAAWRAWRVSQAYRDYQDSSTEDGAGEQTTNEKDDGAEGEKGGGETRGSKQVTPPPRRPVWDPSEPIPSHICAVGEDHLWEADFRDMRVYPAFWPGVSVELLRTTWFYDGSTLNPVPLDVAEELEKNYQRLQPFGATYSHELAMALKLGAEAEQKISCALDETKPGSHVIFLGPYLARIYGQNFGNKLAKTILTAVSGEHGGGTLVIRGWGQASKSQNTFAGDSPASVLKSKRSSNHLRNKSSASAQQDDGERDAEDHDEVDESFDEGAEGKAQQGSAAASTKTNTKATASQTKPNPVHLMEKATRQFWEASRSRAKANIAMLKDQKVEAATVSARSAAGTNLVERLRNIATSSSSSLSSPSAAQGSSFAEKPTPPDSPRSRISEDLEKDRRLQREEDIVRSALAGDEGEEVGEKHPLDLELEPIPNPDEQPLELFFVLHGIGQGMVIEHAVESWSFATAINSFRAIIRERAATTCEPVVKNHHRIQFIPVLWRAAVKAGEEDQRSEEFPPITLNDIFGDDKAIPLIRQIISGVLVDIPMYMSPAHHENIITRVVDEMNRLYRLFLQRNPRNTGKITVNVIGHSLGSAIAMDVLGQQPNHFKDAEGKDGVLDFDVSRLYTIGSPAALFFWMNQKTLIGREDRAKTQDAQEAPTEKEKTRRPITAPARFGSLAVDEIWNCLYTTDPVSTRLNPCVHAGGKHLQPIPAMDVIESLLKGNDGEDEATAPTNKASSLPPSLFALFNKFNAQKPYKADAKEGQSESASSGSPKAPGAADMKAADENATDEHAAEGGPSSVAEELMRARPYFATLNPLGSVDFRLPTISGSSLISNQYFDAVWAHAGYWSDHTFATFLLATTFGSPVAAKR